ncbi:hypothetical protein [Asticcacaulis tiandongensis]|uniref:hypothetical protein n=1 Tax=Asticcacaulis tiandongensis TaxID=2565365 RepID=UPI001127505A|nr:hypothetical protein [Asticcacaulis tiandongensis]
MSTKNPADRTPADVAEHVGKKVFTPGELNQAGEDKEYFPPEKGHEYDVPEDANDNSLTPDVQVAPGNKIKVIDKDTTDKKPE